MTRRTFLKAALALPAGAWLARYRALAEPMKRKVKITGIKAMMLRHNGGDCLIKIETDAGLAGYGEAGATGPMVRARIETMKDLLMGQDPLEIERHFHNMTTLHHTYIAHIPTISGIDIALWDLAGKIVGLPVSNLLGGPFRDKVLLYTDDQPHEFTPATCREFANKVKSHPYGWKIVKVMFQPLLDPERLRPKSGRTVNSLRYSMLTHAETKRIGDAFMNLREAFGPDMDIVVHCLNEYDLPSAVAIAQATAPMKPLWIEDPLPAAYSESWASFKRQSPIKVLTGEKLEMPKQFLPFLQNEALDFIQPDLAYAGGFTGVKKIADLASLYQIPMNLHNYGTLVLAMASVQFAASVFDVFALESFFGKPVVDKQIVEPLSAKPLPAIKDSQIDVPDTPGIGVELNPDVLSSELAPGEVWWG
jgi:L-alanine-DL-glutamate epimerase-like enolase superfamily enzyme